MGSRINVLLHKYILVASNIEVLNLLLICSSTGTFLLHLKKMPKFQIISPPIIICSIKLSCTMGLTSRHKESYGHITPYIYIYMYIYMCVWQMVTNISFKSPLAVLHILQACGSQYSHSLNLGTMLIMMMHV